jgi:hypothetical protein
MPSANSFRCGPADLFVLTAFIHDRPTHRRIRAHLNLGRIREDRGAPKFHNPPAVGYLVCRLSRRRGTGLACSLWSVVSRFLCTRNHYWPSFQAACADFLRCVLLRCRTPFFRQFVLDLTPDFFFAFRFGYVNAWGVFQSFYTSEISKF